MAWALWLATPVLATLLAAIVTWWRNRPRPPLASEQSVDGHRRFLASLDDATSPPARPH